MTYETGQNHRKVMTQSHGSTVLKQCFKAMIARLPLKVLFILFKINVKEISQVYFLIPTFFFSILSCQES